MTWPAKLREHLTTWKSAGESLQAFAVALGILIGGGWTIYQFTKTQQVKRASLELAALEHGEARQALEITIAYTQEPNSGVDRSVLINVSVVNQGARTVTLNMASERLGISPVSHDADLSLYAPTRWRFKHFVQLLPDSNIPSAAVVVWPGETKVLSYLVFLPAAGFYHVDFTVPAETIMQPLYDSLLAATGVDTTFQRRGKPIAGVVYSASRFFAVR